MSQLLKATIDTNATLNNIELFFSSSSACISELIQNSYRAEAKNLIVNLKSKPCLNATGIPSMTNSIESIEIIDDGLGISDFSFLFNFSGSGWKNEIKQNKKPFGIGFFSVLYIAEEITIESNGLKYTFSKNDIIGTHKAGVEAKKSSVAVGTKITLSGINENAPCEIKDANLLAVFLDNQLKAMPLKSVINYTSAHHSLGSNEISASIVNHLVINSDSTCNISTEEYDRCYFEFGTIYIPSTGYRFSPSLNEIVCYLQNQPISIQPSAEGFLGGNLYQPNFSCNDKKIIVHLLDNVKACAPDRKIIHQDQSHLIQNKLLEAIKLHETKKLHQKCLISVGTEDESRFLNQHYFLILEHLNASVLNLFNFVPNHFSTINGYPQINDETPFLEIEEKFSTDKKLDQKWFEDNKAKILIFNPFSVQQSSLAAFIAESDPCTLLFEIDNSVHLMLSKNCNLFEDYWLKEYLLDLTSLSDNLKSEIIVSCDDDKSNKSVCFNDDYHYLNFEFVESFIVKFIIDGVIKWQGHSNEIPFTLCLNQYSEEIDKTYIPYCIDVVHRHLSCFTCYRDQYGNVIELPGERDFHNWITAQLITDEIKALESLFNTFLKDCSLDNETFTVNVKNGVSEIIK